MIHLTFQNAGSEAWGMFHGGMSQPGANGHDSNGTR